MESHPSRRELGRAMRFGLVGLLNTLVDYGVFWLCAVALSGNPYLAQCLGYGCGVVNSYVWNRRWTFSSTEKFFSFQLVKFLGVNGVTLLLSIGALWCFTETFRLPLLWGKLATVVLTMGVGFILNRLWVFSGETPSSSP